MVKCTRFLGTTPDSQPPHYMEVRVQVYATPFTPAAEHWRALNREFKTENNFAWRNSNPDRPACRLVTTATVRQTWGGGGRQTEGGVERATIYTCAVGGRGKWITYQERNLQSCDSSSFVWGTLNFNFALTVKSIIKDLTVSDFLFFQERELISINYNREILRSISALLKHTRKPRKTCVKMADSSNSISFLPFTTPSADVAENTHTSRRSYSDTQYCGAIPPLMRSLTFHFQLTTTFLNHVFQLFNGSTQAAATRDQQQATGINYVTMSFIIPKYHTILAWWDGLHMQNAQEQLTEIRHYENTGVHGRH
jgi:hypothetical protein